LSSFLQKKSKKAAKPLKKFSLFLVTFDFVGAKK